MSIILVKKLERYTLYTCIFKCNIICIADNIATKYFVYMFRIVYLTICLKIDKCLDEAWNLE